VGGAPEPNWLSIQDTSRSRRSRPAGTPVKKRDKAAFLTRIDHAFVTDPMSDTADAVTAVFRLLSDRLTGGEVDKVRHALPSDLRAIWPVEID